MSHKIGATSFESFFPAGESDETAEGCDEPRDYAVTTYSIIAQLTSSEGYQLTAEGDFFNTVDYSTDSYTTS